jgi:hypothetical protein
MLHTRKDKIEEFRAEDVHIPQSAEGAMRSTHAKFWKDAMDLENKGLKERIVMISVTCLKGRLLYRSNGCTP